MAARPSWEGHLRLSLVTCPVSLYPATTEAAAVRFNLINPQTNNRIKMKTVDAGTGEEVSRGDLVKGYEIAKGEYVLFEKDELDAVKLESTRIVDIEKFVPRTSIDRLFWDTPYHLVPSAKTGVEAFAVIRAGMAKQNKVAIGRLVISGHERQQEEIAGTSSRRRRAASWAHGFPCPPDGRLPPPAGAIRASSSSNWRATSSRPRPRSVRHSTGSPPSTAPRCATSTTRSTATPAT